MTTLTLYQKIKKLDKAIKAKQKESRKFTKEKFKLERERTKVFFDYAFNQGIKEGTWQAYIEKEYNSDDVLFRLTGDFTQFPKLIKVVDDEYYSNVDLAKGITLFVKDGYCDIHFTDASKAKDFIAKHKLKVDFSNAKDNYEEICKQKADMEELLTTYGVTLDAQTG